MEVRGAAAGQADEGKASATRSASKSVAATYGGGMVNPFPMYAEFRREQPVIEGDLLARFDVPSQADYAGKGRQVFTVFRHSDVFAILRDDTTWANDILLDGLGAFVGDMMLQAQDGDRHRQIRSLVQPCFRPSAMAEWRRKLEHLLADRFIPPLRATRGMELMADLATPFPIWAIYTLFGFPDRPELLDRFAGWALEMLAGPQSDPEKAAISIPVAQKAAEQIYNNLLDIVADARAAVSEAGLIGILLTSRDENGPLDDQMITQLVRMMLPPATETTSLTLANLIIMLLRNPEQMALLRADRALLPQAISESMRLDPSASFLARRATKDVTVAGVRIPKDAAVSLSISSANRDETVFENPDLFDITRPARLGLGFGAGVHTCIGMPAARMEVELMINVLLELPGLRFDPAVPEPEIRGLQSRGPEEVHLIWDEG